MKISRVRVSAIKALLCCVMVVAIAVRLYGIHGHLPAVYDPDEPLFVVSSLKLLAQRTLDPGWFGHPGTTTIYALALIDLLVLAGGYLTGYFPNVAAFGAAIYADPTIAILPGRLFILACGVACVGLTYALGRSLFEPRVGLIAAALLALCPIHIELSQIIRTDIHASVFMLLALLCAIGIHRRGSARYLIAAGVMVGWACATKWPAATVVLGPLAACLLRGCEGSDNAVRVLRNMAIVGIVALATLVATSPYLVIDFPTLATNLHGEARPRHLGSTGGGLLHNLGWYGGQAMRQAVGSAGLAFAVVGIAAASRRHRIALALLVPTFLVFLLGISVQNLVWPRWIVPILPLLALFSAAGIVAFAGLLRRRVSINLAAALITLLVLTPIAASAWAEATERRTDTRTLAADWARRHIPPGSTIVIEHLAFDLLDHDWRFLFPGGEIGCFDGRAALKGRIDFARTDRLKKGRSILDIGTVNPDVIGSCKADYAVLSHYDRYRAEAEHYPAELAVYRALVSDGRLVAKFVPQQGRMGGPVVRIFKFAYPRRAAGQTSGGAVEVVAPRP